MKIGVRKPNIKNRVRSRTTGRAKRAVKRSINPVYQKKGIGYIKDPERAVKNKIYKKTTVSVEDAAKGKKPGCMVPLVIFLILLGGCALILGSGGSEEEATTATEVTTEATTEYIEPNTTEPSTEPTTAAIPLGSVETTKQLKAQAKADAKNATRADLNTAANYINENIAGCFSDKAMMEQILAYGYLLYYHYGADATAGDLGYNAVKAVRPVYEDGADPASDKVQAYVERVSGDIDMIVNGTAVNPTQATTEATTEATATYLLNTETKVFHDLSSDEVSPENSQLTTKTREELINEGYRPCGNCFQ